ncbi:MAG: histidine--tRNA ligase [Phycisphaerae bacterium]|nr:histidine--tRNA ligase [Phycisphaerae bacterium]
MKISPVKGTRDFYPPQMAVHNWIIGGWKKASLRNGFEEYDGPIFEYLQMYQVKSGDEIVEQLFNFEDRGGRSLAIRPEITPTLARMVNQQINSLPRPIKWFSVPRLCRAERPQKGRLREFFQWNIDIIGVDDVLADAEVIFTSIDYLRQIGLTKNDVKARISSRKLLAAFLEAIGISKEKDETIYPTLDKKAKLPSEAFEQLLSEKVSVQQKGQIGQFMELSSPADVKTILPQADGALAESVDEIMRLFELLDTMGVAQYCVFDPSIVRGLAYYTGVVFEIHDCVGELRAICGGGRYDNLLRDFGGPAIPATGMGMGDCVLEILLEQRGLLPAPATRKLDYFVAYVDEKYRQKAVETVAGLRAAGFAADFSYKAAGLGKQLKQASSLGAAKAVIIGEEIEDGKVAIKDMRSGEQTEAGLDEMLKHGGK